MSSYPPNSASRRPEGSWPPPEDEDFRVVPPPGVSAPPGVSSPVSAPPPAMAAPRPIPPPPPQPPPQAVVTPAPVRAPAKQAAGPKNQRLIIAIGAFIILLLAVGFFIIVQLVLNQSPSVASGSPLIAAATAVAQQKWATAVPGCAALFAAPTPDTSNNKALAQTYLGCGLHLVAPQDPVKHPESPDVDTALKYFRKADQLTPGDATIQHQINLGERYQTAKQTLLKPDIGGYIGQLEWFTKQPEFDTSPYADVPQLLYHAYIDSGNGYLQVPACDLARHRFEQAVAVRFIVDTTEAQRRINDALQSCK
ncbi:MAG TPA: hypothetical protein VKY74_00710 [Chloroflexia bacterium]|nr:hypothetical protein [Chloroflexia bacterium]